MINHIDLGVVLRRTVCDLYSDLVTRPTGAAVRGGIEQQLAELGHRTLTVIDFSHVGLLDYSCADEIVAKLLLRHGATTRAASRVSEATADPVPAGGGAYFLFRGVSDSHLDAIETVLERHGLALTAEDRDGTLTLVGEVDDHERRTWDAVRRLGRAEPDAVALAAGLDAAAAAASIHALCRRRLVMRLGESYVAVGAAP